MRITTRQLRQIIREELMRESAWQKGPTVTLSAEAEMEEDVIDEMGMYDYDLYESQRGNDENSQHDNDTQPGDPYARHLKEARRLRRRV